MRRLLISSLLFFVLFALAMWLSGKHKNSHYFQRKVNIIQKVLQDKETTTYKLLQQINNEIKVNPSGNLFDFYKQKLSSVAGERGISLFAYQSDSLIFWSTNHIPVPTSSFDEDFLFDVVKLKNGWYRLIKFKEDNVLLLGLILIKNDFIINNEFLVDKFQEDFGIKETCQLTFEQKESQHKISAGDGRFLFGLTFGNTSIEPLRYPLLSGALYFFSFFFFLLSIYVLRTLQFFRKHPWLHLIIFAFFLSIVRYANLIYKWPSVLYNLPLFSPVHFASSWWLPSLGDFILNALLVLFSLILLFSHLRTIKIRQISSYQMYMIVYGFGIISAITSWIVLEQIRKLIFDSSIAFDLSNLLALDIYSFLGFGVITLLLIIYLSVIYFFSRTLVLLRKKRFEQLAFHAFISFAVVGSVQFFISHTDPIMLLFPYLIFVSTLAVHSQKIKSLNYYALSPVILLFTIYTTYLLFQFNTEKEFEKRKMLSFKISEEQDHVAEFLFIEAQEKMKRDLLLKRMLFENDVFYPREFFERIAQNYFSGYWSKYILHITPFSTTDYRLLADTLKADPLLLSYERSIKKYGKPTASSNLFFIDNNYGKINYLAKIEITRQLPIGFERKVIFIEFISKIVTQVTGFPELLLDESVTRPVDVGGYSYAIYKEGMLNVSGGEYLFPLKVDEFIPINEELSEKNIREYNHLIYKTPGGKIVVVSRNALKWQDFLSPFAYLLIYFGVILFLFFVFRYIFFNEKQNLQFNFKARIQFSILMILLVSLIVVGLGINNYVISQFNRKNKLNINEKLNSIITELRVRLEEQDDEIQDDAFIGYLLRSFSNVFFTDINLYSPSGTLIASSRESVYNEGLLSRQMDPTAFHALSIQMQPKFTHQEKIGNFRYYSAYATFRNANNEIVGFLNLPYFLRQKELRTELAASLLALINIYSLLIAVSMIITFLIANRLTEPLTVLQEKIGQIRLGRKNEMIDYRSQDEIGSLVSEYNRMIKELEKSAELLARSERETAWREMAKQVAHEVKNPLTPMKLSVQYLLKAWDDKRPDFDERIRKFKDAMIEQIETLSGIASEFSYFAKMPAALKVEINLADLIENCLEFYRNNEKHVEIYFSSKYTGKAMIMADRDQMLRAFNNLLRNAIQAIPEERMGVIEVSLSKENHHYCVLISDNGTGIAEELKDKIFAPNFTTKSSGMGLGLAMTRTIIENMNGEITYETEPGVGTTFIITIPSFNG